MPASHRRWPLFAAGLLGATAVAAGAFGAHGLRRVVSPKSLEIWQTAAHYHMTHSLALLALALAMAAIPQLAASTLASWAVRLWLLGSLIFSVSLYALAVTGIGLLGAITPIGGLLLIAGWLCVALLALSLPRLG